MSAPLPEPFSAEVFTPGCFTAQGKIQAGGQAVSFRSISGAEKARETVLFDTPASFAMSDIRIAIIPPLKKLIRDH